MNRFLLRWKTFATDRGSLAGMLLLGWLVAGCSPAEKPAPARSKAASPSAAGTPTPSGSVPGKMKFKNEAGESVIAFKWYEDGGAKLIDGAEQELARYTWQSGKLKAKNAADQVLGYVTGSAPVFKLEGPDQTTLLFRLQRQEDGDWKLEAPDGELLRRLKQRDYGMEIESPDDQRVATSKKKDDKVSLRDPAEKTIYSTKDGASPEAVACLGLDPVESLALRAALFVRMEKWVREEKGSHP